MRYLWEVVLEAQEKEQELGRLRFFHEPDSSPYMELSLPCLNQTELEGQEEIGVNTYFRFYSIFLDLYGPEQQEFPQLRKSLTNVVLHMLAENDVRMGMTKEEYYKKLLAIDIAGGIFGRKASQVFPTFTKQEQGWLLSGWLRHYQVESPLTVFTDMVHGLIDKSVVYHNNDRPLEILIFINRKEDQVLKEKIKFLIYLFLDIQYHTEIYYEYHFPIIGVEDTMQIDEIAIY